MVKYICDGSAKKKNIGAGVVRKDGKILEKYSFYERVEDRWLQIHEHYSIQKTLLLIREYKDKKTVIFNDDKGLIKRINEFKPIITKENPVLEQKEKELFIEIQNMRNDGFDMAFICDKNAELGNHKIAHKLSRRCRNNKLGDKLEHFVKGDSKVNKQ